MLHSLPETWGSGRGGQERRWKERREKRSVGLGGPRVGLGGLRCQPIPHLGPDQHQPLGKFPWGWSRLTVIWLAVQGKPAGCWGNLEETLLVPSKTSTPSALCPTP